MSRMDALFYASIFCLILVASTAVAVPVTNETESTTLQASEKVSMVAAATATSITETEKDASTVPVSEPERHLKTENMKPREVDSQTETPRANSSASMGNCSSAVQGVWTGGVDIYPEKFILDVHHFNESQRYCAQLNESVQSLQACLTADSNNSVEVAASIKAASLSTMVETLCSQNSTGLKDVDKKDGCMEDVKQATIACSSSVGNYSYPTEMLINGMEPNTCKNLTEAKDCIVSKLANGTACSPEHQQVVFNLMISLLTKCSKDDSAATTEAASISTTSASEATVSSATTPAPSVNVTTKPSHPTASPTRNAAQGLRLHSIPLLLAMAFATVIPAKWI